MPDRPAYRALLRALALVLLLLVAAPAAAQAQATRTWVSGVGDDINPCSRTAPCKTWAGAIAKTAEGGEMDALDSGPYGTVTVPKAMTIDGAGVHASSLFTLAPAGIRVNAPGAAVVLRNLSLNGAGAAGDACDATGLVGIRIDAARSVRIEDVVIDRARNQGILVAPSAGDVSVALDDVTIGDVCTGQGISVAPTGTSTARVTLEDTSIVHTGTGLLVGPGGRAFVHGSRFYDALVGIQTAGTGEIDDLGGNVFAGNGTDGTPTRRSAAALPPAAGPPGPQGAAGPPGAPGPAGPPGPVTRVTPTDVRVDASPCRVPKLVGLKLATARSRLKAAKCAAPNVVRRASTKARRGRVTKQSQAVGKRLGATTKVTLTVGK